MFTVRLSCAVEGYTYSLGSTPLLDSLVFQGFIGVVARGFLRKQHGDARLASSFAASWLGEQCPRKAVVLLGPGPHVGPKVLSTSAPMKRRVAQRGQWPWSKSFASFLLLLLTCHILPDKHNSALSCFANNLWEVYPHENQSKFIEIGSLYNARYTRAID